MSEQTKQLVYLVVGGTFIMVLLLILIVTLVVNYQKRMTAHKLMLKQLEIDRQQELIHSVIDTQEKERQYFARELHDSVGQMLSAIKLNMNGMKRVVAAETEVSQMIDKSIELTVQSIQEVRSISHSMLPGVLLDFGLEEALHQLLRPLEHHQIKYAFHFNTTGEEIKAETELALFRISQELVNNTIKYSGATQIKLSVTANGESLLYSYADNGIGFNPEDFAAGGRKKGLGLRNIESRAKMIEGKINWRSAANEGVQVEIEISGKQFWQKA